MTKVKVEKLTDPSQEAYEGGEFRPPRWAPPPGEYDAVICSCQPYRSTTGEGVDYLAVAVGLRIVDPRPYAGRVTIAHFRFNVSTWIDRKTGEERTRPIGMVLLKNLAALLANDNPPATIEGCVKLLEDSAKGQRPVFVRVKWKDGFSNTDVIGLRAIVGSSK